jgi:hypothetical protein
MPYKFVVITLYKSFRMFITIYKKLTLLVARIRVHKGFDVKNYFITQFLVIRSYESSHKACHPYQSSHKACYPYKFSHKACYPYKSNMLPL